MHQPAALNAWHELVRTHDAAVLKSLLAEEATFHSPIVYKPQQGRPLAFLYLAAAFKVFFNDSFRYVREIVQGNIAVLEFEVELDRILVNGVDMITWNEIDQITDFKVMIRPLKAINLIHQKMAAMLEGSN